MTDFTTPFDRRVHILPHEWKGPSVDVMDTFKTVSRYFSDEETSKLYSPELALGLTKLILERHDAEQRKLDEEAQRNFDCN